MTTLGLLARPVSVAQTNFDTSAIRVCVETLFGVVRKTQHKGLVRFGNPAKRRRLCEHLAQLNRDNSCPEKSAVDGPRLANNAELLVSFFGVPVRPDLRAFSEAGFEKTRSGWIERENLFIPPKRRAF